MPTCNELLHNVTNPKMAITMTEATPLLMEHVSTTSLYLDVKVKLDHLREILEWQQQWRNRLAALYQWIFNCLRLLHTGLGFLTAIVAFGMLSHNPNVMAAVATCSAIASMHSWVEINAFAQTHLATVADLQIIISEIGVYQTRIAAIANASVSHQEQVQLTDISGHLDGFMSSLSTSAILERLEPQLTTIITDTVVDLQQTAAHRTS